MFRNDFNILGYDLLQQREETDSYMYPERRCFLTLDAMLFRSLKGFYLNKGLINYIENCYDTLRCQRGIIIKPIIDLQRLFTK